MAEPIEPPAPAVLQFVSDGRFNEPVLDVIPAKATSEPPSSKTAANPKQKIIVRSNESLKLLVASANRGNPKSLALLGRILDRKPEIWSLVGDLGAHAELTLVDLIAHGDKFLSESMIRHISAMKKDLLGLSPTPLERLTVQRIVTCWLHAQFADSASLTAESNNRPHPYWVKRQESAERRCLLAIKSLKLVREMLPNPTETPLEQKLTSAADLPENSIGITEPDTMQFAGQLDGIEESELPSEVPAENIALSESHTCESNGRLAANRLTPLLAAVGHEGHARNGHFGQ